MSCHVVVMSVDLDLLDLDLNNIADYVTIHFPAQCSYTAMCFPPSKYLGSSLCSGAADKEEQSCY